MASNLNMSRKPNLGLNDFSGFPMNSADFMAMAKDASSSNFPLSNNQLPHNTDATLMGPNAPNPFPTNHYGQASGSFGLPLRQFESPLEVARQKFNPLGNANMAPSMYSTPYSPQQNAANEQFPMNRFQKYRNPDLLNVNKSIEQVNYPQGQRSSNTSPWQTDYLARNQRNMLPNKGTQGLADPAVNQNMNIDQPFANHGGSGGQPPFPMQSRFMPGEMYKQPLPHMNDQQFAPRGMAPNFHPQDFYQQEQMRQMSNAQQYQPPPPHPNKFMGGTPGTSPGPFPQSVIPKGSQESMFSQFGASPKMNGPRPMLNMHNANMADRGGQMPFHNPNFPVSPAGSQIAPKPGFGSPLGMRGTVSPNVTIGSIGLSKKQFQQQDEGVISPSGNQNAAAAAAAAAVLAAVNSATSHTSPQSTGDMHNVPSRPPSIHTKDVNSRSPATSLSDHKSESGGSGINDLGAAPSPARSLPQSSPQVPPASNTPFSSDMATTGRVPSPSVNQLPNSDIEAMIHSVSNIPGQPMPSHDPPSSTSQRIKRESKPSALPNLNTRANLSPVTPPSPFSLSPSITDLELNILSPSWEDSAGGTTPISKIYKLSEDPERKLFLDRLVMLSDQQGKSLRDVPNFTGAPLDLYKFYKLVSDRGGYHEVIRMKLWKEVIQELTNTSEPNPVDSQTLRDHYMRLILPYESKIHLPSSLTPSFSPATSRVVSSAGSFPSPSSASSSQHGSIDLSAMNYKNLPMFQPTPNASPFGQGPPTNPPPNQQAPNYPGSSMPHQMPGYRNVPQVPPSMPGYHGHPSGSQRIPNYPASPSPGYSNKQLPGYPMPGSQMPPYLNSLGQQVPGYRSNNVPPEAMFLREQPSEFPRGSPHIMNKPYQHMPDSQHPSMFPNFPHQPQHSPGMMYHPQAQQHSNHPHYQMSKRQRFGTKPSGGTASPEQRMQSLQNQWGPGSCDPGSSGHSPFHPSQSSKMSRVRPPPPYPHMKQEESSSSSSTMTSQQMKLGGHGSPRKEDVLFPSGCVEATKPSFKRKRRLTARDIGPVEAWRIMMSLKSGLLSETAWALDTLTILLCDDSTVGFFRLAHLPGLLDIVVEHYRRNLINVFGILDDSEIDTGVPRKYSYGNTKEIEENTYKDKIPHLIAEENLSALIVADCLDSDEEEDTKPGFASGSKNWRGGGGDTTIHIQTHFETDPDFYQDRAKTEDENNETTDSNRFETVGPAKGDSVDATSTVTKEETDDHVDQVEQKVKSETEDGKVTNLSCKEVFVYNGVTSPKRTKARRAKISKNIHQNETKIDVKPNICCNGEDGIINERKESLRSPVKMEINDEMKDPSAALIQRLKTELDLDVDSFEASGSKSSEVSTAKEAPTEECELRQEFPLSTLTWSQDSAIKCCICVSNIIRSLSFVPRNDVEMARHPSLLLILGKLFLLHHLQKRKGRPADDAGQHSNKHYWWNDCLEIVRENALVTVANIAGYLDLSLLADTVSYPLLDGLLHWLVCQSTTAVDSFQSISASASALSPKYLALETLAKMSVLESNVDFILTSPDKTRLSKAYEYLVKLFSDKTNEVTREFALVLLSSLTQSDETILSSCSELNLITVLVGFLEDATERVQAMASRGLHPGIFHDDDMHVSVGMLRRAAGLLACIAKRTNSAHLIPFQERILTLSMSNLLDIEVQSHLCNVLFNLPR